MEESECDTGWPTRIDYGELPTVDALLDSAPSQGQARPSTERPELPHPTADQARLEADFMRWGYCVVGDAASRAQGQALREAVVRRAELESSARDEATVSVQTIFNLAAKDDEFRSLLVFDPTVAQGGDLVDTLLTKILGAGFHLATSHGSLLRRGAGSQPLHQDQGFVPLPHPPYPLFCLALWCLTDFDHRTGGTVVVPGSHRVRSGASRVQAGSPRGGTSGDELVAVVAPAGSCILVDSRTLHAVGRRRLSGTRLAVRALYAKAMMRAFGWPKNRTRESLDPERLSARLARLCGVNGFFPYPKR